MGLLFASLSSLFYVALDVLRKLLGQKMAAVPVAMGLNMGALPVYIGALVATGPNTWDGTFAAVATLLAGTQAIASLLYVQAVTLSPLSLTVPYLSLTPVVSALVAWVMVNEVPHLLGAVGIVLVAGGTLALQADDQTQFRTLVVVRFSEPGSWRMLIVAVLWGVTTPLNKIAIAHGSEALLAGWIAVGSAALLGVWWGVGLAGHVPAQEPFALRTASLLALAALVVAGAVLCQFFAYRELLVAYVETIKRFGSLLTVLIGTLAFGEEGLARRLPAATVMAVGVVCLVWR
jgi:drug/metabolite transporter (DMT)-like permease